MDPFRPGLIGPGLPRVVHQEHDGAMVVADIATDALHRSENAIVVFVPDPDESGRRAPRELLADGADLGIRPGNGKTVPGPKRGDADHRGIEVVGGRLQMVGTRPRIAGNFSLLVHDIAVAHRIHHREVAAGSRARWKAPGTPTVTPPSA